MNKINVWLIGMAVACALASPGAHAIDPKYRAKLERSGCTQLSEMQGCDINKTREQNAKAGFASPGAPKPSAFPRYKDLVHRDSIGAIDAMAERGFKDVDSINSANTQYGIFYHAASRLCVQLTMADGEVVSADDIHTHPKCR
jgi:hypothetical protein